MVKNSLKLAVVMLVAAGAGACSRTSEPEKAQEKSLAQPSGAVIARLHWLGKNRLAKETNAVAVMELWNRPQSSNLEQQTLDKLATAPRRFLLGSSTTNAADSLVRPLLDDLLREESYLEARKRPDGSGEVALAVHLETSRALLWQTNLAQALESLTGLKVVRSADGSGWSLKKHHAPNYCQLTRVGNWTLLGLSQDANPSFEALRREVTQHGIPFSTPKTNFWVEVEADLSALPAIFPRLLSLPPNLPRIALTLTGDGKSVRSHATAKFPYSLGLKLDPWMVPTNTIREPLISFTALRGLAGFWHRIPLVSSLQISNPPNEAYVWALARTPFQTFLAARVPEATNLLKTIGPGIIERVNSNLPPNLGSIFANSNGYSLVWTGVPFATPFVYPIADSGAEFLFAGIFPNTIRTNGPPRELLDQFISRSDLVYYDWEVTQERLLQWRYLDDLSHISMTRSHKPALKTESATLQWIGTIVTNLGNSATEISMVNTNEFELKRSSSIGLTGCELELLANWLDSAGFPEPLAPLSKRALGGVIIEPSQTQQAKP